MPVLFWGLLLNLLIACQPALAADDEEAAAPSISYLAMEPKFVVNLQEKRKYLRLDIQLMIEGSDHLEKIKMHQPAIRHALLMLFSEYSMKDLETVEQRENLRAKALDVVRKTLDKYANSDGLRDLFFTEFLIQ